jgi:hypothetical protein
MLMDAVQLLTMFISPQYGFNIDSSNLAWQIFDFVQVQMLAVCEPRSRWVAKCSREAALAMLSELAHSLNLTHTIMLTHNHTQGIAHQSGQGHTIPRANS